MRSHAPQAAAMLGPWLILKAKDDRSPPEQNLGKTLNAEVRDRAFLLNEVHANRRRSRHGTSA
jgi:hypothetical protein